MIDPEEYTAFKGLEHMFRPRIKEIRDYPTQVFVLPDKQRILVRGFEMPAKVYQYHVSPFGVVRVLSERPVKFDKTPLCLQLDEILIAELHHAADL